MYNNIPHELREWTSWVTWRYEETDTRVPTKVPYNPRTGGHASVTNPNTWASFEECSDKVALGYYSGIGFVLSERDPYTFIDLDDTKGDAELFARQQTIHRQFNTYAEISPSGNGLHLITRGHVPSGRKRSKIEVYSAHRFMTMTGNIISPQPIVERQELLTILYNEMGAGAAVSYYGGDFEEKSTDNEIISMAFNAANGAKFSSLMNGDWQGLGYASQSEADFALIDIIAFYTKHKMQIKRIFGMSGLGQRDKGKRSDYLEWMISKSFDRMLPPIDLEALYNSLEVKLAERRREEAAAAEALEMIKAANDGGLPLPLYIGVATKPFIPASDPYTLPPGLLGDIANYVYSSSVRPVKEIALVAAIGLMSGMCGRAWNISNTGLNLYTLLIAPTGTGKEGIKSGISKIVNAVMATATVDNLPAQSMNKFMGPAEIASGQALIKYLKENRSFVSIVGEFGLKMKTLSSEHASSSELMLKRAFLDLFNKSGKGDRVGAMIYSNKADSTEELISPAFSMVGESTPENFFSAIDEGLISDGLLPRFLLIEYNGARVERNRTHAEYNPPFELVRKVSEVAMSAHAWNQKNDALNVGLSPDAEKLLDAFDRYADAQINGSDREVIKHLWNRAHIKALKLAALVAVGECYWQPVVTLGAAQWACNIVAHDTEMLLKRFEAGTVGQPTETFQMAEVMRMVREWHYKEWSAIKDYAPGVDKALHDNHIVPHSYIYRRLSATKAFKNDTGKGTSTNDKFKATISMLIDVGTIAKLTAAEIEKTGIKTRMMAYVVVNPDAL